MVGSAVSWQSKKQDSVALSSTEAEYMVAASATREALWISTFLDELTIIPIQPICNHPCEKHSLSQSNQAHCNPLSFYPQMSQNWRN